jgi:NADH dehydrogenase
MSSEQLPHVVILGGGFAGLNAARELRGAPVRVTLVDRRNHHLFQPLLYQVATAALSAPDIAEPLRKLLRRQENARVLMGEVLDVDVHARRVFLERDTLEYDYLLVATGMTNNYFGHDEWAPHAPGLKSLREALDIRARVLRAYEAAEREPDPERRKQLLTFVVIGGGPTGVEMAGALSEIATRTLARDFRKIRPDEEARVILLEGLDEVLPPFSSESSEAARRSLEEMGVEVRTGAMVSRVDAHGVTVGDEPPIPASTVVWGAGLKATPITARLDTELGRGGRVKVRPDLSLPAHPEVYVLGDLIDLEQDGEPLPGVAQVAIQSGRYAARRIANLVRGAPPAERFVYDDKGTMATIGRARAVADIGKRHFSGFIAWMLWLVIHIFFLAGFRNRLAVLFEWAYAYLTWHRSARVILEAPPRRRPAAERRAILRSVLTEGEQREAERAATP